VEDSLVEPQFRVFWVGFVISVNDFLSFTLDFLVKHVVSFPEISFYFSQYHAISSYLLIGVSLNSHFATAEAGAFPDLLLQ